jgi:EAL domain-containing protein (putative c-di-GMP-specific phosphodiesterase class I)
MPSLLDRVFAPGGVRPRFQPVAEVAATPMRCCYVEALVSGPAGTNLAGADVLFSYIRRKRQSARMDRFCAAQILRAARSLPPDTVVGINIDAETLAGDAGFVEYLRSTACGHGLAPSRLIVEIVEHTWPTDVEAYRSAVAALRGIGMRIALDDVGRAHSNYRMMLETRPDFFKIDRYFVSGAYADPMRRGVIHSIAALARSFGARVVAEGIEEERDLCCVRDLGIDLAQGYLLMRLPPVVEVETGAVREEEPC